MNCQTAATAAIFNYTLFLSQLHEKFSVSGHLFSPRLLSAADPFSRIAFWEAIRYN